MPRSVLTVASVWLVVLVATFVMYERDDVFADFVAFNLGRLPVATIWFGAVGGLLVSAQGIFGHSHTWDSRYDYWHYVRPILGAVMGTLGCLVFIVLNEAATKNQPQTNAIFYDVIALTIGYREQSFRALISKVIDTILLPSESARKPGEGSKGPE